MVQLEKVKIERTLGHAVKIILPSGFKVHLFNTGRGTIAGTRSEEDIKKALQELKEVLSYLGHDIQDVKYAIQNIVASFDTGKKIDLDDLLYNASKIGILVVRW